VDVVPLEPVILRPYRLASLFIQPNLSGVTWSHVIALHPLTRVRSDEDIETPIRAPAVFEFEDAPVVIFRLACSLAVALLLFEFEDALEIALLLFEFEISLEVELQARVARMRHKQNIVKVRMVLMAISQ
jgi:hypothetical protein